MTLVRFIRCGLYYNGGYGLCAQMDKCEMNADQQPIKIMIAIFPCSPPV